MYGGASIGATLNIHYCCGRIEKIALKPIVDDKCPVKKAEKKKGCCQNEQLQIKLSGQYQKTNEARYIATVMAQVLAPQGVELVAPQLLTTSTKSFYKAISPPPLAIPLYIYYRIFLI